MSTPEIDLARHDARVTADERYSTALDNQTDDLIDMIRAGDGVMNCNRDEAISRIDEQELARLVTELALAETPAEIEAKAGALRRVVYDEISGMCREYARKQMDRREAA